MLKIRLQRTGRRNAPAYRLVVAEHSAPIQGKFVEIVGHYIPTKHNRTLEIKADRIKYWISVGAQPSQTVARLCASGGMKDVEKFIKARVMKPSKVEERAKEAAEKKAKADAEVKEAAAKAAEDAKEAEAEAKVEEATKEKAEEVVVEEKKEVEEKVEEEKKEETEAPAKEAVAEEKKEEKSE